MIQRALFLSIFVLFLTLAQSLPITPPKPDPPHPKRELPPAYHFALNLLWAALTAFQVKTVLRILKLPLDTKTRGLFKFVSGAIISRCASYLLTATFAVFVLPSMKETPSQSSLIGTLADSATWSVDVLLFVAVFYPLHERPWTFAALKNLSLNHETFDRVLLGGLAASIFAMTAVSYVHPGPLPFGYSPLRMILAIHLAILAVLIVDCIAWGFILLQREKETGTKGHPIAIMTPFLGLFMIGVWTLRFIQFTNPDTPLPFVLDFFSYILLQAFVYSFMFCAMMGTRKETEVQNRVAIGFGLTVVLLYIIMYIFSRIFPRK